MTPPLPESTPGAATTSRNAPCACGSGRRFKHCCGAAAGPGAARTVGVAGSATAMPIGTTMILALAAQQRGDLERAATLYRQALQAEPDNIDALHMLGVIHFTRGDLVAAERLIRRADGLCPLPVPEIHHNLTMLRERIAMTDRQVESVATIHIDAPDGPLGYVREVCGAQEIAVPGLALPNGMEPEGPGSHAAQRTLFPAIRTFVLEDAVVDAESALPASRSHVILDSHTDLERHQSPEWRYGLYRRGALPDAVERTVCVDDSREPHLPAAVVLTSGYWINWAHFLSEVLPKALIAERRPEWHDWPLLISSLGLANAHELFRVLMAPGRRIVKAHGRVRVDIAGFVSSVGFCPLEYTYDWKAALPAIRPTDCVFSPFALDLVRQAARRFQPATNGDMSPYIYLRRRGATRRLTNQDAVEQVFAARGFRIVAPEVLSVREQLALFSRAKVLAGPTGAAMANMLFSPRGCRLLILAAAHRHSPFHYWLNMAEAAGHRAQYLFGVAEDSAPHPAHRDFHIDDMTKLAAAVDTILEETATS